MHKHTQLDTWRLLCQQRQQKTGATRWTGVSLCVRGCCVLLTLDDLNHDWARWPPKSSPFDTWSFWTIARPAWRAGFRHGSAGLRRSTHVLHLLLRRTALGRTQPSNWEASINFTVSAGQWGKVDIRAWTQYKAIVPIVSTALEMAWGRHHRAAVSLQWLRRLPH